MSLSPDLLEILACPVCKTEVQLTEDGQWLRCVACHRKYPIEDDIPVMLIQRAVFDEEPPGGGEPEPTAGD